MINNDSNINLLLVDDDEIFRENTSLFIKDKINKLFLAENGKEGLDVFDNNKIDIIISDIKMPVMNGLEMAGIIKQKKKEVKIILISSLKKESILTDAINIGIDHFIDKVPGYQQELQYLIKKLTNEIKIQKELNAQIEKNRQLSVAIDQSASILLIFDYRREISYANKKFYSEFKYSPNEVIGKKITDFKDERYNDLLKKSLLGIEAKGEYLHSRKSGSNIWVSSSISPIINNNDIDSYIEVTEVITDRKEMENNLKLARKSAEDASKAKSVFMATMSHELRTPLNGIIGMTSLLLATNLSSKQKEYLILLKNSAESLLKIINDILEISEIESGQIKLKNKRFNPINLVKSIINFYAISAISKNIELSYEIEKNIPEIIIADSGKIREILNNLIGNAVKFTEKGFVQVRVRINETDSQNKILIFEIEDTGLGISENGQKILFERFTQIDQSYTRKFGGTGLGLSISKELAELMGGKISLQSILGKGSIFYLQVPVKTVSENIISYKRNNIHRESINSKRYLYSLNILLAEDNKTNQKIIKELLNKLNHKVTIAENGLSAVQKFDPDKFDLVILDIEMPVMNGFDAARNIKKLDKENKVPVIALTAHSGDEVKDRVYSAGMVNFAEKPIDLISLRNLINQTFINTNEISNVDLPFDLSEILKTFGSNPEGLNNYLSGFLDNIPEIISNLEKILKTENRKEFDEELIEIIDSFKTINADNAVKLLVEIKDDFNKKEKLKENFSIFLFEIKKIENFLSNYIYK